MLKVYHAQAGRATLKNVKSVSDWLELVIAADEETGKTDGILNAHEYARICPTIVFVSHGC